MVRGGLSGLAGVAAACLLLADTAAGAQSRSPVGFWFTEDRKGIIQIEPCGAVLCGAIVGLLEWPAKGPPLDFRGRSQCGFQLLAGLRQGEDGRWHGTVTNPRDGQTYSAEVWVPQDGTLRLHGYIGLPILGSTERFPPSPGGAQPDCHFFKTTLR